MKEERRRVEGKESPRCRGLEAAGERGSRRTESCQDQGGWIVRRRSTETSGGFPKDWVRQRLEGALERAITRLEDRGCAEIITKEAFLTLLKNRRGFDLHSQGDSIFDRILEQACRRAFVGRERTGGGKSGSGFESGLDESFPNGLESRERLLLEIEEAYLAVESGSRNDLEAEGLLLQSEGQSRRLPRFLNRRSVLLLSVAAAAFVGFGVELPDPERKVVEQILDAYRGAEPQVYRGTVRAQHLQPRPLSSLLSGRECRLYTRGPHSRVEAHLPDLDLIWGRDANEGSFWLALPGRYGLRVDEESPVARRVDLLVEMRSLDLGPVLEEIVRSCEIAVVSEGGVRRIVATPPSGLKSSLAQRGGKQGFFSRVLLETPVGEDQISSAVITLVKDGVESGSVHYVFEASENSDGVVAAASKEDPSADRFSLEAHLREGDPIIEGDRVEEILARLEGLTVTELAPPFDEAH